MSLAAKLSSLIEQFVVTGRGLTPSEARFLANWRQKQMDWMSSRLASLSAAAAPLLMAAVALFSLSFQTKIILLTHLSTCAIILGYRLARRWFNVDARPVFLVIQLTFSSGYAFMLHEALTGSSDLNQVAVLAAIFISIMIVNLILCPFANGLVLVSASVHLLQAMLAVTGETALKGLDWTAICAAIAAFSVALFYARVYALRHEALGELAARNLMVEAERSRVELVERELAVASEIQDSFAPREEIFTGQGIAVSFFQIKYDLLGGDWSAARTLPTGELAVVIADATGKGIQAALVIHSIQTIWAEALLESSFDAEAWLASANHTLIALGQRKEHTMSLGLMIMSAHSLRYYSAGHVPLFVVHRQQERTNVTSVVARGNLLGMMDDLRLIPQDIDLTPLHLESVMLGTDGVFDRGIRTRKEDVTSLIRRLQQDGAKGLEECPAQDDKLAVWVHRTAS